MILLLSEKQIQIFKQKLLNRKKKLQSENKQQDDSFAETSLAEATGELTTYDNHPADMGTELVDRQRDMALNQLAKKEHEDIEQALQAIKEGTYGICTVCQQTIPYERLEVVPAALTCVEHNDETNKTEGRGESGGILFSDNNKPFEKRNDEENTFNQAARYGTSETPSDVDGNPDFYKSYSEEPTSTEEYESFLGNDIEGNHTKVYSQKKQEMYTEILDEKNIDSHLGDLPFKRSDGYITEEIDKKEK